MAPSRDSAENAIGLAYVKHLITGGYYKTTTENPDGSQTEEWITAGDQAIHLCQTSPVISRQLGQTTQETTLTGKLLFNANTQFID